MKMAVFALTLVRHGETNCNKEKIMQGQRDTELSEKGIKQAELLGKRLQYENFTHVFSSDLKRTLQTCEIILQENKLTSAAIKQDQRLRERKFGIFEGRPCSEFVKAVRKERMNFTTYVPDGGESSEEVRARAEFFFRDMCTELRQLLLDRDNNCLELSAAGSIKRRRHTSATTVDVFSSTPDSPLDNTILDVTAVATDTSKKLHGSSGSTSSTSGCSSLTATDPEEDLAATASPRYTSGVTTVAAVSPHYSSGVTTAAAALPRYSSGVMTSAEASSLNRDGEHNHITLQSIFDLEIKTNIAPPLGQQHGCPNVSLSPICEHRPAALSSVSSGRNSSFDDGDMVPMLLADVLIVTHGGLLKELVAFFVDRLGCKIPGGARYAQQTSPNTGITKFTVTLSEGENEEPCLTCLTIHDKDHLLSDDVQPLIKCDEV